MTPAMFISRACLTLSRNHFRQAASFTQQLLYVSGLSSWRVQPVCFHMCRRGIVSWTASPLGSGLKYCQGCGSACSSSTTCLCPVCQRQRNGARTFYASKSSSKRHAFRIDGKAIAKEIKDEVKAEVDEIVKQGKRVPHLTVVLVGSDPASMIYVRNKAKAAQYTGITCEILRLPHMVSEEALVEELEALNSDPLVDGVLVQLPLPEHISERRICDTVAPYKDVDGFNVLNVGRFCVDQDCFIPATPSGVLEIIRRLNIDTFGKNAVVCGRSKNVGLPIALHLHSDGNRESNAGDATTTICHRNTPPEQLQVFTRSADILVTATGVPGLITADMVKEGVVVIDVGIRRITDHSGKTRLVGDVDYEGVSEKASYITPVPGGVGPVTVAMLIKNTLRAYHQEIDYGQPTLLH